MTQGTEEQAPPLGDSWQGEPLYEQDGSDFVHVPWRVLLLVPAPPGWWVVRQGKWRSVGTGTHRAHQQVFSAEPVPAWAVIERLSPASDPRSCTQEIVAVCDAGDGTLRPVQDLNVCYVQGETPQDAYIAEYGDRLNPDGWKWSDSEACRDDACQLCQPAVNGTP